MTDHGALTSLRELFGRATQDAVEFHGTQSPDGHLVQTWDGHDIGLFCETQTADDANLITQSVRLARFVASEEAVETVTRMIGDDFGYRQWDNMAADRSKLRGNIGIGYDINEPTQADCFDMARAILNLIASKGIHK